MVGILWGFALSFYYGFFPSFGILFSSFIFFVLIFCGRFLKLFMGFSLWAFMGICFQFLSFVFIFWRVLFQSFMFLILILIFMRFLFSSLMGFFYRLGFVLIFSVFFLSYGFCFHLFWVFVLISYGIFVFIFNGFFIVHGFLVLISHGVSFSSFMRFYWFDWRRSLNFTLCSICRRPWRFWGFESTSKASSVLHRWVNFASLTAKLFLWYLTVLARMHRKQVSLSLFFKKKSKLTKHLKETNKN